MRASAIAAIYGVCAVIALTLYAVREWLDPLTPLWIGLLGILVPALAICFILDPETRPPKLDPLVLAQSVLIAAVFGIAFPIAWTSPNLRLKALSNFGTQRAIDRAMDDPSDKVRQTACHILVQSENRYDVEEVYDTLVGRPQLATSCLAELPSSQRYADINRRLGRVWSQTLMTGENACAYSEAVDSLDLTEGDRGTYLLSCALHAETADSRQCCAERLSTAYPGQKLEMVARQAQDRVIANGTSGYLLAASFDEKTYMRELGNGAKRLKLDSKSFQKLSLETACTAATESDDDPAVFRYLEWLFEQNGSCLSDTEKDLFLDVRAACVELLASGLTGALNKQMCDADKQVRKRRLASAAEAEADEAVAAIAGDIETSREDRFTLEEATDRGFNDPEFLRNLSAQQLNDLKQDSRNADMATVDPIADRKKAMEMLDSLQGDDRVKGLFSKDADKREEAMEAMKERERAAGVVRDRDGNIIKEADSKPSGRK